ncbi:glycosyltransferase [Methylocystis sp. H62]|uniref:glycosyltransferase n=1 Tax=Methylocystis sp. H62 TaxID=2785789 RepID=UPI0018C32162|nr:glycosyltransferase [Methylocystis sp. H62]MBG0792641.1 glycosyltransferase [Methylocystis sp. H62]
MKVSIAMATYNGASWLRDQLESFVGQDRPPDELIVCDDCSTDETFEILDKFRSRAKFKVVIYQNECNIGHLRNFMQALSYCRGDVIFLSDQDDKWYVNKISTLIKMFQRDKTCQVALNDAMYANSNGAELDLTVLEKIRSIHGHPNGHIAGACTAMTREFRDFIIPLDFRDIPQHDVYIHRWAAVLDCKRLTSEVLQIWRIHETNSSQNEMTRPQKISIFSWYLKFRKVDSRADYLNKVDQFTRMKQHLHSRILEFRGMDLLVSEKQVIDALDRRIVAFRNRASLFGMPYVKRLKLIFVMATTGQYKLFYGWKSLLKDLTII